MTCRVHNGVLLCTVKWINWQLVHSKQVLGSKIYIYFIVAVHE